MAMYIYMVQELPADNGSCTIVLHAIHMLMYFAYNIII